MDKLFPVAMMLGSLGASVVYATGGDLRRTLYWFAAAVITAAVTF